MPRVGVLFHIIPASHSFFGKLTVALVSSKCGSLHIHTYKGLGSRMAAIGFNIKLHGCSLNMNMQLWRWLNENKDLYE